MRKNILTAAAATAFAASLALATPATAAVTFDPATGSGFVGKGDVQLAFGWNNSQLQSGAAGVTFAYASETVEELTWVCTNVTHKNLQTQERERTTTTSKSGLVSAVTRDSKKQVTGFTLVEYSGAPVVTKTSEGQKELSCPTDWEVTSSSGPILVSSTSALTATPLNGSPVILPLP